MLMRGACRFSFQPYPDRSRQPGDYTAKIVSLPVPVLFYLSQTGSKPGVKIPPKGWSNETSAFRKFRQCKRNKIPPGNSWRPLTVPLSVAWSLRNPTEDHYTVHRMMISRIL